jgi:two-component system KDP operon response regulator KdpE
MADPARHRGAKIAVMDDDPAIGRLLHRELTAAGFLVVEARPDVNLRAFLSAQCPNLVMLDIESQSAGGARAIADVLKFSSIPLIALSTRGDEDVFVQALELGADDVIRKPFGLRETIARVRAALRRRAREQGKTVRFESGDLTVDLLRRKIWSRGRDVHLPPKSYDVLRLLTENAGQVVRHAKLIADVWGEDRHVPVTYLRFAIRDLRRNLEIDPAHPQHILTETRVGYRLNV